jgi:imidazolonepropionase
LPNHKGESIPQDDWVLIRRARQLLTLHGASGPRRGSATQELQIVPDGALLIRNGIIEESGPTQRIENLQKARGAREIDAMGKVVMPAFVDPDAVLIATPVQVSPTTGETKETALRVLSRRRLEVGANAAAAAWARCGVLTMGAHSGYAKDLRETVKVLKIHKGLQGKPLRIRSIFSPRTPEDLKVKIEQWLPVIRKMSLAPVLELTAGSDDCLSLDDARRVATVAAGLGFSLRIRTATARADAAVCELALEGGVLAIISGMPPPVAYTARLGALGCVHIISAMYTTADDPDIRKQVREALEEGAAFALASSYRTTGPGSFNSQYLLHLATERFGFSDEEAIVAATWNAACSLRMSHVIGSLEPGKSGDVLLMDVPDYRDLSRRPGHSDVQVVLRAGQVIYKRGGLILD